MCVQASKSTGKSGAKQVHKKTNTISLAAIDTVPSDLESSKPRESPRLRKAGFELILT